MYLPQNTPSASISLREVRTKFGVEIAARRRSEGVTVAGLHPVVYSHRLSLFTIAIKVIGWLSARSADIPRVLFTLGPRHALSAPASVESRSYP